MAETITLGDGRTVCLGDVRGPEFSEVGGYFVAPAGGGRFAAAPNFARFVGDTSRLPDSVDYGRKAAAVLARDFLNRTRNTCVLAGLAHQVGVATANDGDSGGPAEIADADVAAQFAAWCTGDGCISTNVFVKAHAEGLLYGGRRYYSDGYVLVPPKAEFVKAAIYLLGGVEVSLNLPDSWRMANDGGVWDVPTSTRVLGSHMVYAYGYDAEYAYVSTWGETRRVTWRALTTHTKGLDVNWGTTWVWGLLLKDWYGPDGVAPSLIDVGALRAVLKDLGDGRMPPLPPLPPPPPPPPVVLGPWAVATTTAPGAKLHVPGLKPRPNIVVKPEIPGTGVATPPANLEEWVRAVVRDELARHQNPNSNRTE